MKKLISLLLALTMVFSLAMAVAAVDYGNSGDGTEAKTEINIKVNYGLTNTGMTSPAETLAFGITLDSVDAGYDANGTQVTASYPDLPVPTLTMSAFAEGAADQNDPDTFGVLKVTLPTAGNYPAVGVYKYKITPNVTTPLGGVHYHKEPMLLVVTVQRDEANNDKFVYASIHTEADYDGVWDPIDGPNTKLDMIPETGEKDGNVGMWYSAGNLDVTKFVSGNMGDKNQYFTVNITLTGATGITYPATVNVTNKGSDTNNPDTIAINAAQPTSFQIKHGDTITIANIPYGVKVTVSEVAATDYDAAKYDDVDLATGSYTKKDLANVTGTAVTGSEIDEALKVVAIYNNRGVDVDTGVILDSAPYILLLAVAIIGLAVVIIKKRQAREY